VKVEWRLGDGSRLRLAANLSDEPVANGSTGLGAPMFALGDLSREHLAPWTVGWWLETPSAG
jgi:maltooligosyltrehalose trehalohydrolase